MSKDEPIKRKLDQVRALQQRKQAWAGSGRIRRMWITPRNKPPYRPYLIMFVTDDGRTIFRTQVMDNSPTSEQMLDELLQAMRHPALGAGRAHRPSVVYLDDADHVAALSPWLADVGVRCEYRDRLPAIESVLYSFERRADKREPIPGLLKIPGVTPPLVGHLYELAADYYRLAPWRWLNDQHPIEIRYPPDSQPRYAVVMGSGGEIFGLAVYDSLDDLKLIYTDRPPSEVFKLHSVFVLFFDEEIAMTFDDLDAMDRYNWPVASKRAYPVFGRSTRKSEITTSKKADVFWAEGALAALLAYVRQHKPMISGVLQPAELTLPVMTISGEAQVYLRLPAMLLSRD